MNTSADKLQVLRKRVFWSTTALVAAVIFVRYWGGQGGRMAKRGH